MLHKLTNERSNVTLELLPVERHYFQKHKTRGRYPFFPAQKRRTGVLLYSSILLNIFHAFLMSNPRNTKFMFIVFLCWIVFVLCFCICNLESFNYTIPTFTFVGRGWS